MFRVFGVSPLPYLCFLRSLVAIGFASICPFAVQDLTRNFLAGFFHSFLDLFPFWINVHSFAAWQARQPLMTKRHKPEFYTESRNPNRTLNFITKPEFASLTCSLT